MLSILPHIFQQKLAVIQVYIVISYPPLPKKSNYYPPKQGNACKYLKRCEVRKTFMESGVHTVSGQE